MNGTPQKGKCLFINEREGVSLFSLTHQIKINSFQPSLPLKTLTPSSSLRPPSLSTSRGSDAVASRRRASSLSPCPVLSLSSFPLFSSSLDFSLSDLSLSEKKYMATTGGRRLGLGEWGAAACGGFAMYIKQDLNAMKSSTSSPPPLSNGRRIWTPPELSLLAGGGAMDFDYPHGDEEDGSGKGSDDEDDIIDQYGDPKAEVGGGGGGAGEIEELRGIGCDVDE